MLSYIGRRLLLALPVFFGICLITFGVVQLTPGDPAEIMLQKYPTPEKVEEVRAREGWDQPLHLQFVRYLGGVLQGDFGMSHQPREPVRDQLLKVVPATVELALAAMLLATLVGVVLGVVSAVKAGSWVDFGSLSVALVGISIPVFWLALIFMHLFAARLGWFPGGDRLSLELMAQIEPVTGFYLVDSLLMGRFDIFLDAVHHLMLPAVCLATIPMALVVRVTRASMLEVLGKDYIRTARAKGLPEDQVVLDHGLKNALIPILTITGTQFGYLLGGAVLTETIFSWPGLGSYIVENVLRKNFRAIQGGVFVMAFTFVTVNLLVDILYAVIDPRVRLAGKDP